MSAQQVKDSITTNLIEFRMAIFYFAMFSINALCSAAMIALTNVTWSTLDTQGKVMIWIALIWNWSNTILAFVSKQATRIKQTGELFPAGDTQLFTRTDLQQTQITKSNLPVDQQLKSEQVSKPVPPVAANS